MQTKWVPKLRELIELRETILKTAFQQEKFQYFSPRKENIIREVRSAVDHYAPSFREQELSRIARKYDEPKSKLDHIVKELEEGHTPDTIEIKEFETKEIEIPTHLYVYRSGNKTLIKIGHRGTHRPEKTTITGLDDKKLGALYDLNEKVTIFIDELTDVIWRYKQERTVGFREKILDEIEQDYCQAEKTHSKQQGYSRALCKKRLKDMKPHVKKEIKKLRKEPDFNYNPNKHYWAEQDRLCIYEAQCLYSKHLPELSDRQIIQNMALIFAATDFWIHKKDEAIRLKTYIVDIENRVKTFERDPQIKAVLYVKPTLA